MAMQDESIEVLDFVIGSDNDAKSLIVMEKVVDFCWHNNVEYSLNTNDSIKFAKAILKTHGIK